MERIQALIDKLYHQKNEGNSPAQLLLTVQLLQAELMQLQKKNGTLGTAKVAITLPARPLPAVEVPAQAPPPSQPAEEKTVYELGTHPEAVEYSDEEPQPAPRQQAPAPAPTPQPKKAVEERSSYILRKPPVTEVVPHSEPVQTGMINPAFAATAEVPTPTLAQHTDVNPVSAKEVHELIGEKKTSLNDILKQERTEVAHRLTDAPIKDLRKGIGINDRFTFVSELFRGDEAMYERSIKTINNFHIFSEAEYWMSRELRTKLGWNEDAPTVQHFYQLVRRRFS